MTIHQIIKGIDGSNWIYTKPEKTDETVKVPLLSQAQNIMDRYADSIKDEILFPVFSNQKVNKYLKEVMLQLKIKKTITFHSARHTFATTVTLSNGVPIETVSKLLGHTKLSTTQIYARVLENKISADMLALRQVLNQ